MTAMAATGISTGPDQGRPRAERAAQLTHDGLAALLKIRHEPELVADAIAIPVLFTLLFTYLFGGALSGSTHQYLLPAARNTGDVGPADHRQRRGQPEQ